MEQPETITREVEQIQQATARDARRRALVAGCVGNLVEWYDFAIYGAFAIVLAAVFFPGADPAGGLFGVLAVFGVAFLACPAGPAPGRAGRRHRRRVRRVGVAARAPLADTLRTARRSVVVGFGIVAAVTATFNTVFVFLPGHLAGHRARPLVPGAGGGAGRPAGGRRCRAARRPGLRSDGSPAAAVHRCRRPPGAHGAGDRAPAPRGTRGLVLGYSLIGLARGTLVPSTFLVRRTGATLSPAWYATALTAVATACVLLAPETAGRPLDAASDRASDARG
jgi:hypothetical protein